MRPSVLTTATTTAVLSAAGYPAPTSCSKLVHCYFHADRTPSLRLFDRGFRCFGCGAHGGVSDLVVALGLARNRAEAARWLEEHVSLIRSVSSRRIRTSTKLVVRFIKCSATSRKIFDNVASRETTISGTSMAFHASRTAWPNLGAESAKTPPSSSSRAKGRGQTSSARPLCYNKCGRRCMALVCQLHRTLSRR